MAASCSPSVWAQEAAFKFELTPYAAYRVGGEFKEEDGDSFDLEESNAQGLIFNIRAQANTQWEVLYGRQDTEVDSQSNTVNDPVVDLDVEYLHFGGTYLFDGESVRPFLALTIGATHFDPRPGEFDSETYFSGSIGGGVQVRATKRIGFRLEGRIFTTLVQSDSRIFCVSSGGAVCLIDVDGTTLTQFEARAGLVFRF